MFICTRKIVLLIASISSLIALIGMSEVIDKVIQQNSERIIDSVVEKQVAVADTDKKESILVQNQEQINRLDKDCLNKAETQSLATHDRADVADTTDATPFQVTQKSAFESLDKNSDALLKSDVQDKRSVAHPVDLVANKDDIDTVNVEPSACLSEHVQERKLKLDDTEATECQCLVDNDVRQRSSYDIDKGLDSIDRADSAVDTSVPIVSTDSVDPSGTHENMPEISATDSLLSSSNKTSLVVSDSNCNHNAKPILVEDYLDSAEKTVDVTSKPEVECGKSRSVPAVEAGEEPLLRTGLKDAGDTLELPVSLERKESLEVTHSSSNVSISILRDRKIAHTQHRELPETQTVVEAVGTENTKEPILFEVSSGPAEKLVDVTSKPAVESSKPGNVSPSEVGEAPSLRTELKDATNRLELSEELERKEPLEASRSTANVSLSSDKRAVCSQRRELSETKTASESLEVESIEEPILVEASSGPAEKLIDVDSKPALEGSKSSNVPAVEAGEVPRLNVGVSDDSHKVDQSSTTNASEVQSKESTAQEALPLSAKHAPATVEQAAVAQALQKQKQLQDKKRAAIKPEKTLDSSDRKLVPQETPDASIVQIQSQETEVEHIPEALPQKKLTPSKNGMLSSRMRPLVAPPGSGSVIALQQAMKQFQSFSEVCTEASKSLAEEARQASNDTARKQHFRLQCMRWVTRIVTVATPLVVAAVQTKVQGNSNNDILLEDFATQYVREHPIRLPELEQTAKSLSSKGMQEQLGALVQQAPEMLPKVLENLAVSVSKVRLIP